MHFIQNTTDMIRQTVVWTECYDHEGQTQTQHCKTNIYKYRATFLLWKVAPEIQFATSVSTFEAEPTRMTLQCCVAHFGFIYLTTFGSVLSYNHRISQDLSTVLTASRERKDQRKSVQYKKGWELVRRGGKFDASWWRDSRKSKKDRVVCNAKNILLLWMRSPTRGWWLWWGICCIR